MTGRIEGEVYYDPYDVGIVHDPYPTYAALRDAAPLYHNPAYRFWALSRFADVEKALGNWETFSNSRSEIHDGSVGKNGVPPPTAVGEITIRYSSTSPARTIGAANVAPATSS